MCGTWITYITSSEHRISDERVPGVAFATASPRAGIAWYEVHEEGVMV
jgi:hypothetical protein